MPTTVRSAVLLVLLLVVLSGCTPAQVPTPTPTSTPVGIAVPPRQPAPTPADFPAVLGDPFNISVGASVVFTGAELRLTFLAVKNDSQCPIDAVCVRAGDATVQLSVQAAVADAVPVTLVAGVEDPAKATATVDGYSLTALDLSPAPFASKPISQGDYVLRLVVRPVRQRKTAPTGGLSLSEGTGDATNA